MKKNLLLLFGAGLFCSLHISAQVTITDLNLEAQHTDITVMDWDNDGDLDLLISGESNGPINMKAYLNDGTGVYTETTVPFMPVTRSSFDWNDINQDGNADFLESGFGANGAYTRIFNSDGSGVFTENALTLPQMSPTSGFADFNNDGYTDIYVFGNNDQGKSKILLNNKAGGFTDSQAFDSYSFYFDTDVSVADMDNDKDLDVLVTARDFDAAATKFSRIFKNSNGVFTEMILNPIDMGYGSSVWGDYDGDGFLDLLLSGDGPNNSFFSYRLYKNNGGTSFAIADTFHFGQFSTGDGGRFLDWDNDGDLDIVVTGWTGTRQATAIYINVANTFIEYSENASLPGFSESSIEVADVDNDTDLDLFLTGFSGNDFDGDLSFGPLNKNASLVITNPSLVPDLEPLPPTNLSVAGSTTSLTMSWSSSIDLTPLQPGSSLSYNLFLVDGAGKWYYYPLSDTTTGKLRLQRLGNVNLNLGWTILGLPAGTYRWGVQAVDNSFVGSQFAKSEFTINADGTLPVKLSSYTAQADGKKAKIEWTTASEQNNDRFEVLRSANGREFYKLATVEGKGTTSDVNRYFVYDNNPSKGTNYYKLIQYNTDGKSTDHGIRTVNFSSDSKVLVVAYPNPSKDDIGIQLSNYQGRNLSVSMVNINGKLIHKETMLTDNGQGYYKLHLKTKPVAGQYILVVNGEGLKESLKIIVR